MSVSPKKIDSGFGKARPLPGSFRVAAIQMASGPNVGGNLSEAGRLIKMAADQGASIVALPEYFAIMGMRETDKINAAEDFGKGPIQEFLARAAVRYGVWIVGGSVPIKTIKGSAPLTGSDPKKIRNSCLVFNSEGHCVARYDKIHLFGFRRGAEHYEEEKTIQIIMSILSNYVPNCIVRAEVSCPVEDLAEKKIENPKEFAEKFVQAVRIAEIEPFRAVTHNKGIMNGVDAVVLATGNDFRAVEAGVHAYAARNGSYSSLSHATIENGIFTFWMEIPLALGTVGGLTSLHPLVKLALEILNKPSAHQLMQLVAVTGLAQNFAALRSLTTTGIQEGHMKMHLNNILNQHQATLEERKAIAKYFEKNVVSHASVVELIENLRK